jgi:hypothetical protein
LSYVQDFYQTDGVQLSIQVVNNNLQKFSNPLQKTSNPTTEDNYNLYKQIAIVKNKEYIKKNEGLGV